jgi:hypothetical protein
MEVSPFLLLFSGKAEKKAVMVSEEGGESPTTKKKSGLFPFPAASLFIFLKKKKQRRGVFCARVYISAANPAGQLLCNDFFHCQ